MLWFHLLRNSATVQSRRGRKRTALYLILAIIVGLLLLMFFFGRNGSEEEAYNPEANPHVKIGDGIGMGLRNEE